MSSHQQEPLNPGANRLDDEQLTIRIPNPKIFMQRQSLWIGRRGKPRCDNCRSNNLKCDRQLPVCNHCTWTGGAECKYTPLPTPAHRGIPRCDRCRVKNIKCDRNLPVCNNCSERSDASTCNYTPKKRNKARTELDITAGISEGSNDQNHLKIARDSDSKAKSDYPEASQGHTFYGHNIASTQKRSISPFSGSETVSDLDTSHTGRFTADLMRPSYPSASFARTQSHFPASPIEFIPHPFSSDQKILIHNAHIEPWTHPSFPPLPQFVSQRLRLVDPVEMPNREGFDRTLTTFLESMMGELREISCFSFDLYTKVAKALSSGDLSSLSPRIRMWVSVHHITSGSKKKNIILVPRETLTSTHEASLETSRQRVVDEILDGNVDAHALQAHQYDRLPVQNQIYDILTYAHRSHLSSTQMLVEVARLRFAFITWPMMEMYVRACPLCNLRGSQERPHGKSPSPGSSS